MKKPSRIPNPAATWWEASGRVAKIIYDWLAELDAAVKQLIDIVDATGPGDMLKSVYDTDNDGKVDVAELAESVAWNDVTGRPSTFPPDAHSHPDATTGASGFMSASDKTKLNGIESGATADQTPAEILAALLTVDGSGSGLDADLLDGQSSAFFRDASNLNAGTLPAARFDDTAHGTRAGGTLHSAATTSVAGFLTAADKTKLDGITAAASFTPTVIGTTTAGVGTYGTQSGTYSRVGNCVFFNISIVWSAHTGTGNLRLDGLPVTSAAMTQPVMLRVNNLTFTGQLQAYVVSGTTQIALEGVSAGVASAVAIDTAASVQVSGHYYV